MAETKKKRKKKTPAKSAALSEAIAAAVEWSEKDLEKSTVQPEEGLSKPAADSIAETIKALHSYIKTADKRLSEFFTTEEYAKLKKIFPDIEQWIIDTLAEDPGGLLWVSFYVAKILGENVPAIQEYTQEINYNGSIADFLNNGPEDPETGELMPGHLEKALLLADGFAPSELFPTREQPPAAPADSLDIALANFFNIPNSPLGDMIFQILIAGDKIASLPLRKRGVAHSAKYMVSVSGGHTLQVTRRSQNEEYIVEHPYIELLTGNNQSIKKIYVLILMKANEQAIYNGKLLKDYISFPLQELVDLKIYKTLRTARAGFTEAMDALTYFKVKGKRTRGKKTEETAAKIALLFPSADITNNQCTVYLNRNLDWSFIISYFTIMPPFYFSLPNRASDLLYYIFYLARQRTKEIARQGYFTISFRAIQARLNLPSEIGLNNPQRDIKDVIETAIEQIEEANSAYYGNTDFTLLPVYKEGDRVPIADYLDNGYLKVSFSGLPAASFLEIQKKTEKQVAAHKKRIESHPAP